MLFRSSRFPILSAKQIPYASGNNASFSTLFDTLHAIVVTGDNGLELLIHVEINTVELEGKYYKALVKEGDKVTKGQPLLKFDIEGIRSAGYNTVTPVIITNSDEYESVEQVAIGDVEKSALVMNVR